MTTVRRYLYHIYKPYIHTVECNGYIAPLYCPVSTPAPSTQHPQTKLYMGPEKQVIDGFYSPAHPIYCTLQVKPSEPKTIKRQCPEIIDSCHLDCNHS